MTTTKPAASKAAKPATAKSAPAKKPAARAAATKPAAKPVAAKAVAEAPSAVAAATEGPKKRYRMLTGIDDSAFCQKVSDALADGYHLYGSPTMTFDGTNVIVGQAVILKKLPKKDKHKK